MLSFRDQKMARVKSSIPQTTKSGFATRLYYARQHDERDGRGSEWGLVFSVICPQFLVFPVKLANILMFTVFGENTV